MGIQDKSSIYRMWTYVFLGSFLIGVVIMNLGSGLFLGEEGIFNTASMNRMKYMEVDSGSFFQYALMERLQSLFILGLLSTTCFGIAAVYIGILWQGVLTGMIITAAAIRFGMKGLLLILAGVFPQQLLFVPAAVMMLAWCYQNCCFLYYPHKYIKAFYRNKKQQYFHQAFVLLWIVGVIVIGCILECYVNPILISDLIKIF